MTGASRNCAGRSWARRRPTFLITPLSALAAGSQPTQDQGHASSIFNIMRNLGGSIGIAVLATYLTVREHYHFSVVSERLTQNSLKVAEWTGAMSRYFAAQGAASDAAHQQALAQLQVIVRREAYVMAYSDCFFLIGIALSVSILALFLIPKPKKPDAAAGH